MLAAGRRAASLGPRWLYRRHYSSLLRPSVARILSNRSADRHDQGRQTVYRRQLVSMKLHTAVGPGEYVPSNYLFAIKPRMEALQGKVIPFNLPETGEGIQTVEIREWLVKPGDHVTMGDPICEIQSDKATATLYVPFNGIVRELMYEVDDTATKDQPLIMVEVEGEEEGDTQQQGPPQDKPQETQQQQQDQVQSKATPSGKTLATPAVRKMAMEHGISLSDIIGTGKEGRVLKEDILRHIETMKVPKVPSTPPPPPTVHPPTPTPPPITPSPPTILTQDRTEPVKGIKAVMVRTMTASGNVPQFGYCDEIDMTTLVELRSQLKFQLQERGGVRFSYMPVIIKALSMALHRYPILNATVDPECTTITIRADHNIGVAMDTAEGLIVPNIKQVQHKSVFEIAVELNRLHDLGLRGQLLTSDVTSGTFSLSNIGPIGGTYTRPMLLPPEVAIGAFGKIQVLPRFGEDGSLRKAHIMQVSWSADHRVIDGATVARFSNLWKSFLEVPASMIVDLK